ncbi:hypothetical protein [Ottowia testudinis]|uniref:DUF4124 domain-containing protein n=1 Tax=Ottowia testudinis TaxID=2816950 RepID=A0A975CFJ9_9BURK|nr:hypothetical protein [Ottowia testudinis]QTD45518.1 hypothetical protein J1M35_00890 [Ottowia testudinis]
MALESNPDIEAPLRPPEPPEASGLWRWGVAAVLVLVIIAGAYQAYEWLVNDVARRRAVAEAPAAPARAPSPEPPGRDSGRPVPRTISPAQPSAPAAEGLAPAVTGEAIHKCLIDGQVTYTNHPCPDGSSSAVRPDAAGADPNGVSGSAGDEVPTVRVARPVNLGSGDPSQQTAVCGYLTAEIARLDFEFKQPLPPNVLDHISSQLSGLRAQHGAAKCDPLPKADPNNKPTPAARKRAPAKVVEEKRDE